MFFPLFVCLFALVDMCPYGCVSAWMSVCTPTVCLLVSAWVALHNIAIHPPLVGWLIDCLDNTLGDWMDNVLVD